MGASPLTFGLCSSPSTLEGSHPISSEVVRGEADFCCGSRWDSASAAASSDTSLLRREREASSTHLSGAPILGVTPVTAAAE